ncbi:MAG: FIST N-terminal domain-containing protein [Chlamydiales bacterium]|nr:FIST N-terminal domain-containing protein [Chlamydiales bacterium]
MATRFVSGLSQEGDSFKAGQVVSREAMDKLGGVKPDLGILFCSSDYDYRSLLQGIRSSIGETPLVGCSSAGGFTEEGLVKNGVTLALVASDSHKFYTGFGQNLKKNEMGALAAACQQFPDTVQGFPNLSAFLFLDGLVGMGEETVLAASSVLNERVKFAGGAAADDLEFKKTQVFCNEKIAEDSVSICYTASKKPMIIKVGHGHRALTEPLTITRAQGNVLYEIDGRPAADIWKEQLLKKASELGISKRDIEDPSNFSRLLLKHEAGLVTRNGYKMRFPVSCNPDNSLNFVCTLAEGAVIKIMDSTPDDQIASAKATAKAAFEVAKGTKIAGAVIFDCACREMILKSRFIEAVEAMKLALGNIPMIGCETYGEIAMEKGELSGFHNTTTVIVLIPD